ncbi:MAG: hypothetical protein CMH64_00320 [Nanoarchaeota archaeon]|nr:hypothetical protein [Nanoarchaeota archaeon]|tara:strand:- start:2402 stop:3886 length:1485 start_codon:yes stop_codon:yes gene_type:complete
MKILVLYCRFGGDESHITDIYSRVPMGVAYVGGALRKAGFDVHLRDGTFYRNWSEFEEDLKKIKPDALGISFTTSLEKQVNKYISITRKILPDTAIIAGGAHSTAHPGSVLEDFDVDFVIHGEGEIAFPELLTFLNEKGGRKNVIGKKIEVKGVAYRVGKKIEVNSQRPFVDNLDELAWPARDLLPMEKYLKNVPLMPLPYPSTGLLVSKGCFGNCIFCQPILRKLSGSRNRYRGVEDVIKEIKYLIKTYKIKSLDIGNDEPTYDRNWMISFCDALIREKINIKWGLPSRVDTVDPEMLNKMGKAGCVYIAYGIESGSQKMMDNLRKGTKVEQAEKALKWTEEAGILGRSNLMVGSMGETKETIQETINFIKRAKPDLIFCAATIPLFGTDLYDISKKEGIFVEGTDGITDYDFGHLKIKDLSTDELRAGLNRIVKTYKRNLVMFMLNPKMLFRKRHIYIRMFLYFFSLINNRKGLVKVMDHYFNYGRHVKSKN